MNGQAFVCVASYGKEKVQTSPNKDPLGSIEAILADLEAEYYAERVKYLQHIWYVNKAIKELESVDEIRVLQFRYIDGLLWPEVFEKMNYCESKCYDLHNSALKNLGIV